jgi:hypothetical protein
MTSMLVDQLVKRAMELSIDALEDDAGMTELRRLANGDDQALERAIRVCLAQSTSLAIRHRAIELLARARYEGPTSSA